jgi:hypothetical protein
MDSQGYSTGVEALVAFRQLTILANLVWLVGWTHTFLDGLQLWRGMAM